MSCAALCLPSIALARSAERAVLSGHVPPAIAKSALVGQLPETNRLRLAIGLPLRNQEALTNLLRDLYTPGSLTYHHYLTPAQFAEQFGPTEADFQAVVSFAHSNGLTMTGQYHPNRVLLDVEGSVADIQRAFGMTMRLYKHPVETNRTYYAPSSEPSVPAGLSVLDISGLDDYALPHPNFHVNSNTNSPNAKPNFGAGPGGNYMGNDFRAAYVPGVTLTGLGQTVGLLQFDGYFPSDILAYESQNGLPNVPLVNILLDGYNGAPTGGNGTMEVSLDIEMVVSMAPGISKVLLYEAGPRGIPNDILNRMATDDLANQLSASWGWGRGPQASTEQIFLQMAAQGQTFCHSSADSDAFAPGQVDDPNQIFTPSSSPNILQVGGTTLSTTGPAGAWTSETVWQWGGGAGSCGGISSFYAIPPWQAGIDMTANQGSTTHRNIPDVAMVADNIYVIADQGIPMTGIGGTSVASPLWAAFTALVNQQATSSGEAPVGFMNPAIYAIGTGPNYGLCFHDITTGNNTNDASPNLFFAVPGYDLCTGWGTPTGSNLINTLAPAESVPAFVVITNTVAGGNGNGFIDPNECNSLFVVLQNIGPADATTVQATLSTTTPGVTIAGPHGSYPNIPTGGSATNVNPFEISTAPTFICGSPIFLTLTIKCDQNVTTKVFSLTTGTAGPPIRFDNSMPVTIAGGSTIGTSSTINVTNINSALQHVSVSAFVFESLDFALTLQLVGPDGTTVTLSQNNGGSGQNFGIDCTDQDRTTFDDNGPVFIVNGQAPFIGTFQPQGALSAFNSKSGTNINGAWQLLAVDPFTGDFGVIECWSLFLSPAVCLDGGGQCPGVDLALGMTGLPQPVLVQSNLTYTMSITNLGPDTATGVALVQNLPASVSVVSVALSQGVSVQASNLISCNLGTLVVGQVATVTVVVTPNSPGTIFSSATVGSQQQELNPANNSATVENLVQKPAADLGISLVASPNPVLLNGLLTYTATVLNHGPSLASNVIVTNTLPLNVSFVSASTSQGTVANIGNVIIIASVGDLDVGSSAVVTMQVRPQVLGQITAKSVVSSSVTDPALANNSSTVNVTVTSASDLVLTMAGPASVVVGSNVTYQLNVLNLGPSPATGISLRDALPAKVKLLATNSSQGTISFASNTVTCLISNLAVNASATLNITVGTSNLIGSAPITIVNTANVNAAQADPNTTNNTASISTLVTFPTVNVVAAGYQLAGESFLPTNGMIEPGEQVTLLLRLQNLGNVDTGPNLTATLLGTNGVTPANGGQVQNYGTLTASGPAASRTFTFNASGTNGGMITASLQVANNGTNLQVVNFPFSLAASNSFANTNDIIIPDHGPGVPYPSTNVVSGVAGLVGKVTVTFTNLNHTFPDDVDMLLVGPKGQNVLLMSHAGGNGVLSNSLVAFDPGVTNSDGSAKYLPPSSQITPGSYQPSQYGAVNFTNNFNATIAISSNNPPPQPPYGTNLDIYNGTDPNGSWFLYVFDSSVGDQGIVRGGWRLGITSGSTVNPVVDLGVSGVAAPSPVMLGAALTYTFTVTNRGPNPASVVQFTNVLPSNVTFISATNSAHTPCATNANGAVYCTLTNLASAGSVTVTVVVVPNAAGTLASVASVTGSDSDPNQSNNSATVTTTANAPVADLVITMIGASNSIVGSNVLYTITVTNNGPGTALGVVVTDPLMAQLSFASGNSLGSAGAPSVVGGAVVCDVGSLAPGTGATINLFLTATQALTITNTVTAATASNDPNPANNSATVTTTFNTPAPSIIAGSARLISGPANGSLIPGQTVTIALSLANIGSADTSNLLATLLATGGVVSPGDPQNYGVLVHGGPAVAKNFGFTVSGANGGTLSAVLGLNDGATSLGTVSFAFNLPATNSYANSANIIIPDHGAASPYPSVITVTNLAGVVTKATVTLSNYNHKFPSDVQILLAGPSGQNVVLEAGNGGGVPITNVNLTFDDAASASLPVTSQFGDAGIVSGVFLPTDEGLGLPFPNPAPVTPSGSLLSAFNGSVPTGNWALYVFDNSPGADGNIALGWSLNLTAVNPVNSASDIGVSLAKSSGPSYQGIPLTLTVSVTNNGPANAANVMVTNTLPPGLDFAGTSLGSYTTGPGGTFIFNLGTINSGSSTSFTISATPSASVVYTSTASVGSDQTDLNLQDNTSQVSLQVLSAPKLSIKPGLVNGNFALTISVNGAAGVYQIVASTNLALSLNNWTTIGTFTNSVQSSQFTDTNAANLPFRYYRAILVP